MRRFIEWLSDLWHSSDLEAAQEANLHLQQENLRLQDRLDAGLEDRAKLWHLVEVAQHEERAAYQMHINAAWQRQSGTIPYPDAPHLPPHAVPTPVKGGEPVGRRGRMLPSEMVGQATRAFVAKQLHIEPS